MDSTGIKHFEIIVATNLDVMSIIILYNILTSLSRNYFIFCVLSTAGDHTEGYQWPLLWRNDSRVR